MAARESFEQSQLASQIGIGYGEAQVLPDRAALIEQTRANKAREAAAAAKAKAKADKKKEEDLEIEFPNDLAPAIQAGIQKEAFDGYEYLLPYHGTPEYEKKKKEWSIGFGAKVAAAKIESAKFKENLKVYGKNRESMNYNPDTDDDISKVMDYNTEATWDEIMGDANKANEDLTTSYKTRGESYLDDKIMSQVEYQTEKGSIDIVDPISGAKRTIKTEDFTLDQAKDIIRKNYQTDQNVNDLYRTALSKMTDDDKKQYGEDLNGVGDYIADKMAPPYVKKISQVSKTAGWRPRDEKPTGYDFTTDVVTEARPINISTPYSKDGKGISRYSKGTSYVSWTPPRDISFILPTGVDVIPFDIKENDNWDDTMKEVKKSFEKPGSGSFKLAEVSTMNAYGPGTVGRKNSNIKLEGLLADEFFNMTEEEILAEYSSQKGYTDADRKRDIDWIRKTKEGMVKAPMAIIKRTSGTEEEKNTTYYVPYDKVKGKITNKFNKSQKPYVEQVENALYMRDEQPTSGGTTTGGGLPDFDELPPLEEPGK